MSAGLTSISSVEVEDYCEAVRLALTDLPHEVKDDLLEDLPDHLREVLAEGDGSLRDRLGEPTDYASELRSAVGLEPDDNAASSTAAHLRARLSELAQRTRLVGDRNDRRLGRALAYPRLSDLAQAIRPGWWVLRGWLLAELVCGINADYAWQHGFIPHADRSQLGGALVTVVAIVASIWLGRWSLRFSPWPRALMAAASIALAIWGVSFLVDNIGGGSPTSSVVVPASSAEPGDQAPDPDPTMSFGGGPVATSAPSSNAPTPP